MVDIFFSNTLLMWYAAHKRDLPWRDTRDPYRIWLSEIILQQTRIEQGLNYYFEFVKLFPTVFDLAKANQDKVLKAWQGLGYYSRARNLHATAKFIAEANQGKFPKRAEELQKLKGVGPYTAAAIASFAFREPTPVVDGNVLRFLSRYTGSSRPIDKNEGLKFIRETATVLISKKDPDLWNQAVMEFGSLQCKPSPNCGSCVFDSTCEAYKRGIVKDLPIKVGKTKVKEKHLYYLVLNDAKHVFVKKRPEKGIWAGLMDFPLIESDTPIKTQQVIAKFSNEFNGITIVGASEPVKHLLSHRKLMVTFIEAEVGVLPRWQTSTYQPHDLDRMDELAWPKVIQNYLENQ